MPLEKVLGQAGPEVKLAHRKLESSWIASIGVGSKEAAETDIVK